MSKESRDLEQIKQDILRKQALLFEKRLDDYLRLEGLDERAQKELAHQLIQNGFPPEEPNN